MYAVTAGHGLQEIRDLGLVHGFDLRRVEETVDSGRKLE
jgi:hypothetical protein